MENKVAENPFKNRVLAETNRLEDGANAPTERSHASYSLEARLCLHCIQSNQYRYGTFYGCF